MSFPRHPKYKDSGVEWLGEIPATWTVVELKHIADVSTGMAKGKDHAGRSTIAVPYLRVANVQNGYLDLDDVAQMEIPVADLARYSLKPGDVLMNEGGDFDKLGRGCVWNGQIDPCITQNHVFAVRPRSVRSEWLSAITGSDYAQFYFKTRAKQSTNLASISSTNLMELPVVLPPPDEQTAIVAFLDREAAKIDALVTEQQRLIELLNEKRQAIMSHAITRGLNPGVPMKHSRIEWLGDVPAHWRISRVKNLSALITSGPRGWSERVADGGDLFVQSGDLNDSLQVEFKSAKRVLVEDGAEASRARLKNGDVVVCITGVKTGNVAVCAFVPEVAYVNQHVCLIRPSHEVLSAFLGIVLKSVVGQTYFELSQYGLKQGLSLDDVREAPVLLPPLGEQATIVSWLETETANLNALIFEAQRAIQLLRERRMALISAVVTGQIDVRAIAQRAAA